MGIRQVSDGITPSLNRIQTQLNQLPRQAHDFWVKATPRRTGNARNKTRLSGNTIHANYPYAQRLDDGYSRQAPQGMSEPTNNFLTRLIQRILRK